MSSDKFCCVPGCKESRATNAVLHHFPSPIKDRDRLNAWLIAIGGHVNFLDENILHLRRVCRLHFENKYHCRNNRLSIFAVPTLHLPDSLQSPNYATRNPMRPLQLNSSEPMTSEDQEVNESRIPISQYLQQMPDISMNIEDQMTNKENIDSNSIPVLKCTESTFKINIKRGKATKISRCVLLSHEEKKLFDKIASAKRRISRLQHTIKKQKMSLRVANKLSTNPAVLHAMENSSSTAKMLMLLQWRENKKKDKGRRFTLQEKILALSILKQSPKAYRFLRKILVLPASQTLIKLIGQCDLQPGINEKIFSQLKKKAEKMTIQEKVCVLLFDEVALKAQISFNEKKDRVTGFTDNGETVIPELADHAQVFMVRGLMKNYKQPVSYTFSQNATKGPELAKQIKTVITELKKAGLIVVATVCDQGTNNRQAIKLLINETRGVYLRRGEEPKENIILIDDEEIIPLYDPPHLLKCMRNNLLTKNLLYSKDGVTKIAKWSHLTNLLKENPGYKGIRLIPKLTEHHVDPEKLNKMKVKFASQIFSRTVASNMGYLAEKEILPTECKETADLLFLMDNIFDSVNGSFKKNKHAKPLLGPATPNSAHKKMWAEAKTVFSSMKFINGHGREEKVPTINNWVWTLQGIELLLKNIEIKYGIKSVWLRHLNQDPLENFFGAIRSHGCRNVNPTCQQFEAAYATLLINNLSSVHTQGKNCENDFSNALYSFVINNSNSKATSNCIIDMDKLLNMNLTPISEKQNDPRIIGPLQYVSGYFLKKAKSLIFKSCSDCSNKLSDKNEIEYIKYREYAGRRWLCTPSNELIILISNMQDIINEILKDNIQSINLKEIIKTYISAIVNFDFISCVIHKRKLIDYLINSVCRFFIFQYCKNVNQILIGKRHVDDESDKLQVKAKKHRKKCYKRKLS